MASIFSRIIQGEIPCYKIADTDRLFAFLDVNPLAEGHVLVVPKTETDYIFDVDDSTLSEMIVLSKKIAIAQQKVIPCLRVGVAVIGLEVPHAHIHLIPMNSMKDINFSLPKLKLTSERMSKIASSITSFLEV